MINNITITIASRAKNNIAGFRLMRNGPGASDGLQPHSKEETVLSFPLSFFERNTAPKSAVHTRIITVKNAIIYPQFPF